MKLMSVDHDSCIDKLLEYVPDLMQKLNDMFNKSIQQKENKTNKIINEMRNKNLYNASTNKQKSPEVRMQEKRVDKNKDKAINEVERRFAEADGEI